MSKLEAVFLGLLQGLTEFLPISSSGHLVLVEHLMQLPVEDYLFFDLLLHLATLSAVCLFYRRRLLGLLTSAAAKFSPTPMQATQQYEWQMLVGVIISTLVSIAFGLLFQLSGFMNVMREQLVYLGLCFLGTAGLLLLTRLLRVSPKGSAWPMNLLAFALFMGLAQSIAMLPGISRAGATVCTALLLGCRKEQAVEYSFIMSIPIIIVAMIYQSLYASWTLPLTTALLGFVSALISGILFLWLLVWIVRKGQLHRFSFYLIPLGFAVIWYAL